MTTGTHYSINFNMEMAGFKPDETYRATYLPITT